MSVTAFKDAFKKLNYRDKDELFKFISKEMASTATGSRITFSDIRESRFSKGVKCPHCNSEKIKCHGKYKKRQRYKCKECGRTFNDLTCTPMAGTHMPDKWAKHIRLVSDGKTLKQVAEELEIHISTAFYWRHKVLKALNSIDAEMLSGVVESDETFFLESNKGKSQVSGRKAR